MRKVSTPSLWCKDCYLSKKKTGYFFSKWSISPKVCPFTISDPLKGLASGREGSVQPCLKLFFRLVKYQRSYRSPAEYVIICHCRGSLSLETQQRRVWTFSQGLHCHLSLLLLRNPQRQDFAHWQFALGQRNLRIQLFHRASCNSADRNHVYKTYTCGRQICT